MVGDGGIFGEWTEDEFGLPAYLYTMDQRVDARADTRSILMPPRCHWHQVANDRITAVSTNHGWTQLYSHERGPRWINQYRSDRQAYAGGVSYIHDLKDGTTWSTFYEDLPAEALVTRTFGIGYFRFCIEFKGLRVTRTVFAPFGDGRLLGACVDIENIGPDHKALRHGEYWDVMWHEILLGVSTTMDDVELMIRNREQRSAHTFGGYGADFDPDLSILRARHPFGFLEQEVHQPAALSSQVRPDVILAPLSGCYSWVVSREDLFGKGGRRDPDGLRNPTMRMVKQREFRGPSYAGGEGGPDKEQKQEVAFLATCDFELAPGEKKHFEHAFGAVPAAEITQELAGLGSNLQATFEASCESWRQVLPHVNMNGDQALARELAWSSYYVRSSACFNETLQGRPILQGGVYQFGAGMNAGPRATLMHAMSLIWTSPDIARDSLTFTFQETAPDGEIPYLDYGDGLIGSMNGEYYPCDKEIYLLWTVAEYVLAVRDRDYLRRVASHHPSPYTRPAPIYEHCLEAFRRLTEKTGTGLHGMIRLRRADWNDFIVHEISDAFEERLEKEELLARLWNEAEGSWATAFGAYVLERFAEMAFYHHDPKTAVEARAQAERYRHAIREAWTGSHVLRGYLLEREPFGHTDVFTDVQGWALLSGALDPEQEKVLAELLVEKATTRLGARASIDCGEGLRPTLGGGPWYFQNIPLARGLAKIMPEAGWHEYLCNTLTNHAREEPEIWYGIWSGPDAYVPDDYWRDRNESGHSPSAGRTYPTMENWPIQIAFAHSEPINGSLWLCGIEGCAQGLRIDPTLPFENWSWSGGMLHIYYHTDRVKGALGAISSERIDVDVRLPSGLAHGDIKVRSGQRVIPHKVEKGMVRFPLSVGPAECTPFEIVAAGPQ